MSRKPGVTFPDELPISALVREIALAIDGNQVVIVAGETGSGKTTQLPKIALAMGRGLDARIGVTQPRRIAATSVAARVASELGVQLGDEVGYQIRFVNRCTPGTYVKFMTDGILLAEIQGDPLLRAYDTLILDEAHERSLNIDFLLGYMKRILPKRPELRVVISSATLEVDRFAAFYEGAPVLQVSGRTFPVETIYRPPTADESELSEAIANTVEEITALDPREDILVFLPGEREIRETADALAEHALPHTVVLPLYGRLSQAEQARVFSRLSQRRIVLATNVAETSLTIPGIVYVIDTGVARLNRYQARSGVTQLFVEPVARASADQRKGRAGRTQRGVAYRIYEQADYESRPPYTDPELLRVGLSGAILQMKALGLGDIREFPFLDPPPKRAVDEGHRVLEEIGALESDGALSEIGKKLSRLPLDPRIGRMILGGDEQGALREALVIAAALGLQDPRERPLAAQRQADQAHRRFADERSDFIGLLKLWRFYQTETKDRTQSQTKKLCRDSFLSNQRMREWIDVHQQLTNVARELGFRPNEKPASDESVHRAVLPGLLSRIGMWHSDSRSYIGARQTRFVLHPSSALAKKPPAWVVVSELVETSQLFGRVAAAIDPAWLESLAGALTRKSYGDPYFAERTAQVMAKEHVTLYGLPIVRERRVHFGPIDPPAARTIFIRHALARGEYVTTPTPAFILHNRAVLAEVARLRDRARRSDLVADEDALGVFFEARVPDHVHSGKSFEAWRSGAEANDAALLRLSLADVLLGETADLSPARFPEALVLGGAKVPLTYRFEPSEDDDGVAMAVPVALLPQLDPSVLEWTIPGWHAEKVAQLCYGLPKSIQRSVALTRELIEQVASALRPFEGSMVEALSTVFFELTGVRIAPSAFRPEELPPHLHFYFRVFDGKTLLGEGRDLPDLKRRFDARGRDAFRALPVSRVEQLGITAFPRAGLPEVVMVPVSGEQQLCGYPALVDAERGVDLRVLEARAVADAATRAGLRRLYLTALATNIDTLEKQLPARIASSTLADSSLKPRRQIAARAVDEAFVLCDARGFPRTERAFIERLDSGKVRLSTTMAELGALVSEVASELDAARAMLKSLAGKPGAPRAALEDVRVQLEYLVSADLLERAPRARLRALPRYLRAIRIRLERLPNGPQKDQAKAEALKPFWNDWLTQHRALLARGVPREEVDAFRYLIEEARVSVFAPEAGSNLALSAKRLSEAWNDLLAR